MSDKTYTTKELFMLLLNDLQLWKNKGLKRIDRDQYLHRIKRGKEIKEATMAKRLRDAGYTQITESRTIEATWSE